MKKISMTFFLMLIFSFQNTLLAATFSTELQDKIFKRADKVKEIILDVENSCARGCRYRVSNVREIKMIEKISPLHFFTWTYVDSVRDFSYFSEIRAVESSPGKMVIYSLTPSSNVIQRLRAQSGKPHQTFFDQFDSSWTLEEKFDSQGNFSYTMVLYQAKAVTQSPLIRIFGGTLKREMRRTGKEILENLKL